MGKTIALIDDSSVMRSIIRKSISMMDLEVAEFLEAENGADGFKLIESNSDKLDLIITDLHMPVTSGVEMMEKLSESGGTKIPIIVISTVGDKEMQAKCKSLGAIAFLEKPFSHDDIEGIIRIVFPI